tara:strand:+ start:295 stop:801 length:507 start_codon:yes stop_codon:yes gene_type:complete
METKIQSLLISAILATTVRLFMYIFGGHESYLRAAIDRMGITVVILEICIVLLRFLSALSVMRYLIPKANLNEELGAFVFTILGIFTTYVLTTLPLLMPLQYKSGNVALQYLSSRPFELFPVVVEYVSLYLISQNVLGSQSFSYITCLSIVALIIAIHDTDYKNTRNL